MFFSAAPRTSSELSLGEQAQQLARSEEVSSSPRECEASPSSASFTLLVGTCDAFVPLICATQHCARCDADRPAGQSEFASVEHQGSLSTTTPTQSKLPPVQFSSLARRHCRVWRRFQPEAANVFLLFPHRFQVNQLLPSNSLYTTHELHHGRTAPTQRCTTTHDSVPTNKIRTMLLEFEILRTPPEISSTICFWPMPSRVWEHGLTHGKEMEVWAEGVQLVSLTNIHTTAHTILTE